MAVSIRGGSPLVVATTSNPVSGTLTGTRQPQTGDVLLIFHGNDFHAFASMTTPTVGGSTSGVTAVTGGSADAGTNSAHVIAYTYVVGSTGDLTVAATEGAPADEEKMLVVYVLSGVDTAAPVDAAAGAFSSTGQASQVAASVSPTSSDAFLIIHNNSGGGGTANPYTPPSSPFTELYDANTGGISYVGGVEQLSAAGATGTRTFTGLGSTSWAAVSVAIKTAAAGSAPVVGKTSRILRPGAGPSNLGRFLQRRRATTTPPAGADVTGTATGAFIFTATGSGERGVTGQAAGSYSFTGSAAGVPEVLGAAAGSYTFAGTAAGARGAVGQAAGSYTFTGVASGQTAGAVPGQGIAAFTFTATASGQRGVVGATTAALSFTATAAGVRATFGTGTGVFDFTGSATGVRGRLGQALAQIVFTAAAAGVPAGAVTTRPFTGTTARPTSSTTVRPFTGVTERP